MFHYYSSVFVLSIRNAKEEFIVSKNCLLNEQFATVSRVYICTCTGADPGGGGDLGIDFYSGFRKKSRYTLV